MCLFLAAEEALPQTRIAEHCAFCEFLLLHVCIVVIFWLNEYVISHVVECAFTRWQLELAPAHNLNSGRVKKDVVQNWISPSCMKPYRFVLIISRRNKQLMPLQLSWIGKHSQLQGSWCLITLPFFWQWHSLIQFNKAVCDVNTLKYMLVVFCCGRLQTQG